MTPHDTNIARHCEERVSERRSNLGVAINPGLLANDQIASSKTPRNDGTAAGRGVAVRKWLHAQLVAPLFAPMGGTTRRSPRDRRGVALILALLFIVLLTVLVVEFGYETQVDASLASNSAGDVEAYLAARSGVARGMAMLWDHLVLIEQGASGDPQGNNNNGQTPIPGGAGEQYDSKYDEWATGIPFEKLNENATMRTSISDEYGKINLNALLIPGNNNGQPQERQALVNILRAFFMARYNLGDNKGDASSFDPTNAILDWLDYGEDENERDDGAEDDYYMGLEVPYHCKNGPMDSIEELLLIKGITPEIYFGNEEEGQLPLSDLLTVHGHWGGAININTASEEVLNAVFDAGNQDGTLQRITPVQMQQLQEQLSMGPIYTMGELQGMGLAYLPGNNNPNRTNARGVDRNNDGIDDNTGERLFIDRDNDGRDDNTGQPRNTNPNNNRRTSLRAPGFREIHAELPSPTAILSGLYTPYASLAPMQAPAVETSTRSPRFMLAQGVISDGVNGNGNGNGNRNGRDPAPVDANGDGLDDRTGRPINGGGNSGPFVISSNCFRIYGDGMQDDVLVRIEAYVWRNSPFLNPNEVSAMLPPQLQKDGPWQPPAENFRILDWKVIR